MNMKPVNKIDNNQILFCVYVWALYSFISNIVHKRFEVESVIIGTGSGLFL